MKLSRPEKQLERYSKLYAKAFSMVPTLVSDKGKNGVPDWPSYCFLPFAGFYSALCYQYRTDSLSLNQGIDLLYCSLYGTWQYSKGIYRFDHALISALRDTDISGDLPWEPLLRLPEPCIYIDLIDYGVEFEEGEPVYGVFVALEYDVNTNIPELRIAFDLADHLWSAVVILGPWTLAEALRKVAISASRTAGREISYDDDTIKSLSQTLTPIINLCLYLCSEEPDLEPESKQSRSQRAPAKTPKLVPAAKAKYINVGRQISKSLQSLYVVVPGAKKRPHMRRGHWHGFWRGPRDGKREFFYKWLPPQIVAAGVDEK